MSGAGGGVSTEYLCGDRIRPGPQLNKLHVVQDTDRNTFSSVM